MRVLFLKWLLLQALTISALVGLGAVYGSRLHGSSLIAVPLILSVLTVASAYGGLLAWREDDEGLEWLAFSAWLCQTIGIMATVLGAWILLEGTSDTSALGDRIQNGLGVALIGTFVGVFASVVLELERRLIESSI